MSPEAWDDLEGSIPPAETLDLRGHGPAIDLLSRNYRNNRLHHAWLISGPKGTGKATMAFRFAEFLLRHPDPASAPEVFSIHDDPVHSQVAKGAHPNLLVLRRPWDQKAKKFKTQITVDEVRRTAAFLQTASGADAWRIVIVDPADDMTTSAANALLKILEEPPRRTVFFVLAHSPRGLLPTIRSRCQVLPVKPLSDENVSGILASQPLTADLSAAEMQQLVARAGGSVRRALEFASGDVLQVFEAFVKLSNAAEPDIASLHQLAGKLTPVAKAADFRLFADLLNDHLAAQLRSLAGNDQVSMARLNRLTEIWEAFRLQNMRVETWNMDRKQVILNLYRDLRTA
jgi:DNA polymerase-3 subunit delta'